MIGEAVASSVAILEAMDPDLPWRQIRGLRNAVIHEYFRVDLTILWETVQTDIPALRAALQRILVRVDAQRGDVGRED